MKRFFAGLLAALIACVGTARAEAPPVVAPGVPVGTGLQPVAIYDASGNIVSSFGGGGGGGGGATGSVTPAGTNGSVAQAIQGINGGVNVGVSAASWPLPTGAATAAAQTTGNASLASLDAKTPALVGGRQPVDGSGVTQPVSLPAGSQTTTGALEPPTAAPGKMTVTRMPLAANTSTVVAASNNARIGFGIQCGNDLGTSAAAVSVDETGATLTGVGMAQGTLFMPASSSGPVYFSPPYATRAAITAYTATAQRCIVTEYLR